MVQKSLAARVDELTEQVKKLSGLARQVDALKKEIKAKESRLAALEDIEAIQRLQCAYGYYLEHWMSEEIIACFSKSPEVSATFVEGTYKGPEGIRRYFGRMPSAPPDFMHQVMQVSPVITLDTKGTSARGRWYGYGALALPAGKGARQLYMSVVYEMEYIKEEGIWKIFRLDLLMHYAYSPENGWVSPQKLKAAEIPAEPMKLNPDKWAEYETGYPSGFILPHSFKHPVTGEETPETRINAGLKLEPNRYRT
ncbi:MAG TPA: nuclear transport factor 2 family protein [Dehalococcoidales bacterium]|nr:nuclear transport factor 2 family protein [Dehalococcoidales bacterium]